MSKVRLELGASLLSVGDDSDNPEGELPSSLFAPQVLVLVSKLPYHESFQQLLKEFVVHHLPSWVQAGSSSGIPLEHLQELYHAAARPVRIELPAPWRQRKLTLPASSSSTLSSSAAEPSSSNEATESTKPETTPPEAMSLGALQPVPESPNSLPPVPESPASMSSPESGPGDNNASNSSSTTKQRGAVAMYFEEDFRGQQGLSSTKGSGGGGSGSSSALDSGRRVRRLLRPPPGSVRHISVCGKQLLLPSRHAAEWEDEFGARCLEADMAPLFTHLQPSNVIRLFSSVLLERSVLVVANDSGPLFHTLEALRALVFPLTWYHIYLPVLPEAFEGMTGQLQAPVTYLMGCTKGVDELMENIKFENCVVADLDDDVVRKKSGV